MGKNGIRETDALSDTEAQRKAQLGKNIPTESDVLSATESFRNDQLSRNLISDKDLETIANALREAQLKSNVPKSSDVLELSEEQRRSMLSKTVPRTTDLERLSSPLRESMLANTVPFIIDLEKLSIPYRQAAIARTVAVITDIARLNEGYREQALARTVPVITDIESENEAFRESNLANNVPFDTDISVLSQAYRNALLARNIPVTTDVLQLSESFRMDQLSANIPSTSDILTDTQAFRNDLLSMNIPSNQNILIMSIPFLMDNLSANVPSTSDILTDTEPYRNDQLSANIPSTSDILTDTEPYRNDQLSANIPSTSDILTDSQPYYQSNIANNIPVFSNLEFDSEPYRVENVARNQAGVFRSLVDDTEPYRQQQLSRNNGGLFGVDIFGLGTQAFIGISRNFALGLVVREILMTRNKWTPRNPYDISRDEVILKGEYPSYYGGQTTKDAILDQVSRNGIESVAFSNYSADGQRKAGPASLFKAGDGPAEQLMAKTVAGNPLDDPKDPFAASEFKAGPTKQGIKDIMRRIGSTRSGSELSINYRYGTRTFVVGVNSDGTKKERRQRWSVTNPYAPGDAGYLPFYLTNYAIPVGQAATMYFPPYISSFQETENGNWNTIEILGRPEPMYTYNNSTRSGSITFYVLTDFAQRVELGIDYTSDDLKTQTYTFDNIRFTGRDARTMQRSEVGKVNYTSDRTMALETRKQELEDKISQLNLHAAGAIYSELNDAGRVETRDPMTGVVYNRAFEDYQTQFPETAQAVKNRYDANKMQEEINQINLKLAEEAELQSGFVRLSESNEQGGNVYAGVLNASSSNEAALHNPDAVSLRDTKERLDEMKKNLQFQPAFFSGDKVDFISRMTFLSRTVRPTASAGLKGFSFTKPPICHLRLGDYIHHDVVITNISKNYSDSVWCLETGEVQPMWCEVTMAFNIIGQYNSSGRPLTASDEGGYYNQRPGSVASVEFGDLTYAEDFGSTKAGTVQYNLSNYGPTQSELSSNSTR